MDNKKNILITGCSHGGIGYATAIYLRDKGYQVFASARKQEDVDKLKAEGFDTYLIDVTNYQQVDQALEAILAKTAGKLDAVFNNAGFGQVGALEDIDTQFIKKQFETNVFAVHNLTNKAIKIMRKQGHGKIIQHSSILGLIGMRYRGSYVASKYALEGMTDTMRLELRDTNIFISLLNTGPVTSKFRENALKTIDNVEVENSPHNKEYYRIMLGNHKPIPFNLPAIEVAKVVEKILIAKKPRPRYFITKATWIMATLKKILPTNTLDKILRKY
ncbi:SDR family NAD(P)-dependent oxidoreductase [Francisella sciaenopsi]|uniref:SDR family NAD(P)-dependent oxidoreductase n=1 Tax=Francisella sciaenopsi TaxID=3055034 RepID=A0ABQ6PEQ2_9GAMM